MEFIKNLIPENIIYASGIMLLHMLWQGLVIASLLGFLLIILRKSSPQSRYIASVSSLVLFPVVGLYTFFSQLKSYYIFIEGKLSIAGGTLAGAGSEPTILNEFLSLYINYLPLIIFIWVLGIIILVLKSIGNLVVLQRLKSFYLKAVPEKLQVLINKVKDKFKIEKNVSSFLSGKVSSPMVIGHAKPVLLLPENIISDFTEEEIKVILQHEMAHIKRNDYLINIFQKIVEIIFFFHPAVWWISNIIRKEREECCDVYAIENEKDKITLAKALTALQEKQHHISTSYNLSFSGNCNNLLKRIKNMFTNRPALPSFKEGIIVTLFFVSSMTFLSFAVQKGATNQDGSGEKKKTAVNGQLQNGEHIFAKIDTTGNIEKLFIEGKKVNKRKFENYQEAVDSLIASETSLRTSKGSSIVQKDPQVNGRNLSDLQGDIQEALDDLAEDLDEEAIKALRESDTGSIYSQIMTSVKAELESELGMNFSEDMFSINVDENGEKVYINFNENGFYLKVDEENEKVKMSFDEDGMKIDVVEDGKSTVHINIGPGKFEIDVDE